MESREEYQKGFLRCKINLSINPWAEYHPRVFEGGSLGAFMLVRRADPKIVQMPMPKDLVEGVHYAAFSTKEELIEKCHYYLAHPEERRAIGKALCQILKEQYSSQAWCQQTLQQYRQRLARCLEEGSVSKLWKIPEGLGSTA